MNLRWKEKFHGRIADTASGRFLIPGTYMNESGKSVAAAAVFYKLKPEEILVVHDDLELPFGSIALRTGGGPAGHNGLKSIKKLIGADGFHRLRIGIGRPEKGGVDSWVLGRFSPLEENMLPDILDAAADSIREALTEKGTLNFQKPPHIIYT